MMTARLDVDVMPSVWNSAMPVTYHRLQVSLKLSPPTQKPRGLQTIFSLNADQKCRLYDIYVYSSWKSVRLYAELQLYHISQFQSFIQDYINFK